MAAFLARSNRHGYQWMIAVAVAIIVAAFLFSMIGDLGGNGGKPVSPAYIPDAICAAHDGLPDTNCTPGATDSRVTQDNIQRTICVPGWSTRVRPRTGVTNRIKLERMAAYGILNLPPSDFELDHLISLELGGHPTAIENLWPEAWTGDANARVKDRLENAAHRAVCDGMMPLAEAQHKISANWEAFYQELVGGDLAVPPGEGVAAPAEPAR